LRGEDRRRLWESIKGLPLPSFLTFIHSIICFTRPRCQNFVGTFAKISFYCNHLSLCCSWILNFLCFELVKLRALDSLCLFCILLRILKSSCEFSSKLWNLKLFGTNPKYVQTEFGNAVSFNPWNLLAYVVIWVLILTIHYKKLCGISRLCCRKSSENLNVGNTCL